MYQIDDTEDICDNIFGKVGNRKKIFAIRKIRKGNIMYYFIINPKARSGKAADIWREIKALCDKNEIQYRYVYTNYAGQMTDIMKRLTASGEPKHIVILGGDGSFNEAVNGLLNPDIHKLTFLPAGSGNDLSRGLELTKEPLELFQQMVEEDAGEELQERYIDLGSVTYRQKGEERERLFSVSCGLGFDAGICKEANTSRLKKILNKIHLGKFSYVIIGVKQLFTWKPQPALLWVDDAQEPMRLERFLFMSAHVNPYEGGGYPFCPEAKNDDGYLDLCVAAGLRLPSLFPLVLLSKCGKHVGKKGIQIIRCKKVRIQVEEALAFHTDGEVHEDQREIAICSNATGYWLIS